MRPFRSSLGLLLPTTFKVCVADPVAGQLGGIVMMNFLR